MTTPDVLANAANIDQNAATPAAEVARRVDLLNQNGHAWMPADMQTTLASAPQPVESLMNVADRIKSTLASVWDGFSEATDDSILHKQPSMALAATRMLNSSLGPLPIAGPDLQTIQSQMQQQGFGKGLDANGDWGPDWNDAYDEWSEHAIHRKLAGDQTGSISVGSVAHGIFSDIIPTHAVSALLGFAKSIPGDARNLLANMYASQASILPDLTHPNVGNLINVASNLIPYVGSIASGSLGQGASAQGEQGAARIESFGRRAGPLSVAQYKGQDIGYSDLARNVGFILNFVPIGGAGSAAAKAAAGAFAEGVTKDAAQRSTGMIAKTLFGGLDRNALRLTDADHLGVFGSSRSALTAEERNVIGSRRGLLNSEFIRHLPLLGKVGPMTGKLADADGLYYRLRTTGANLYQYPVVRVAGDVGQRTLMTGAAIRAGAQVQNHFAPNSMSNQILTSDVDRSIARIAGTPGERAFNDAINALGFVLHGPLGDAALTTHAGDAVAAVVHSTAAANSEGIEGAWQRAAALAAHTKTLPNVNNTLYKGFGSPEMARLFLNEQLADFAASHKAEQLADKLDGVRFGDPGFREAVGARADDVWNDPGLHQAAMRELHAQTDALQNAFLRHMLNAKQDDEGNFNLQGVPDFTIKGYTTRGQKWMEAGSHVTAMWREGRMNEMIGAQGNAVAREAQDALDMGVNAQSSTPIRLLSTTRANFVSRTTQMFRRVQSGVQRVTDMVNQQVADAEARVASYADDAPPERTIEARNLLTSAKRRQERVFAAIQSGDLYRIENIMLGHSGARGTHLEWQLLANDGRVFRNLVRSAMAPGEDFNLQNLLDGGFDPDTLYSSVNGPPAKNVGAPIGGSEWISENANPAAGSVGIANKDTLSIEQALNDITAFRARAAHIYAAGADPDRIENLAEDMRDYGFTKLNLTRRTLGFQSDPERLADILAKHAQNLASDLKPTFDASPQTLAHLQTLDDLGFKMMGGAHIGHIWDGSLPPYEDLQGSVKYTRRFTEALGLRLGSVTNDDRAETTKLGVNRSLLEAQHAGKITVPAGTTVSDIPAVLQDKGILTPELGWPERVVYALTDAARMHKYGLMEAEQRLGDPALAAKDYKDSHAVYLGIREIPRGRAMKALMEPATGMGPNGPWRWDGMDKASAAATVRAIIRGYADRPNSMYGLSTLEDRFRAFSFMSNVADVFPNSGALAAFVNAPNELIQLRNRARFTLSPFFDIRRWVKTNYKMYVDGVSPVGDPLKRLITSGDFDKAHTLVNRLLGAPGPDAAGFADADRYLHSQSIWGKYNLRHYQAYFALEKQREGYDDEAIRTAMRRVFDYGPIRESGRSALESTANTIFFPFSFEKNLIRNTGMYFLDHPQQALLLTAGMELYRRANQDDKISNWADEHLPILEDLQKFNAFSHGISPGQFGGINAPLLNLFLPQLWEGKDFNRKNLERLLPVIGDLSELTKDMIAQGKITYAASANTVDYALGGFKPRGPYDPYRPTITALAQRTKAEQMKNQLVTQLQNVVNQNDHADPQNQVTWPDGQGLPPSIVGLPINRTTIGQLVQRYYPAYNPDFGQQYAEKEAKQAQTSINLLREKNPAEAQQWGVLVKLADSYQQKVYADEYGTDEAVEVTKQFRTYATWAAENEPGFYDFYDAHFAWLFGPLTTVEGQN